MEIRLTKTEASKLLIERVVKDTQPLHGLGDGFFDVKWEGDSVTLTIREHRYYCGSCQRPSSTLYCGDCDEPCRDKPPIVPQATTDCTKEKK